MKKLNNMLRLKQTSFIGVFTLLIIFVMSSCNKDFPDTLRKNYPDDELEAKGDQRKVLMLIFDGVRGQAVASLQPENMTALSRNATYSYDALVDAGSNTMTNAGGWANTLTGVDANKHKIISEDFVGNQLSQFPTLFTRLKNINSTYRTVSLASSNAFNTNLAIDATEKQALATDEEVKNALVDELKNKDAKLIVAQFHSADAAGLAGGYETTNLDYTQAINTLDTYLGTVVEELKARKNYKNENWLIVVASNKGGQLSTPPTDATAYDSSVRNSFVIFYNPKFFRQNFAKPKIDALPYNGYAPRYAANGAINATSILSNTNVGNFGTSGEFTLMFKMKHNAANQLFYPVWFAKRDPFNSVGSTGWGFLFGANGYQLDWGGTPRPGGGDIRDGIWHTIGFTIRVEGGNRTLSLFTDGVKKSSNNIGSKNIDNSIPMRIGADKANNGSEITNFMVKDLVILNTGLSDADMAKYMRKEMSTSSPLFANLLGWWPMNETTGTKIMDFSGKGNAFNANEYVDFTSFDDSSPNISPEVTPASYRAVINNIDIPTQIYQWMGISAISSWSLDGRVWKVLYTSVRN